MKGVWWVVVGENLPYCCRETAPLLEIALQFTAELIDVESEVVLINTHYFIHITKT